MKDYQYVTPTVTSSDPRMVKAIDGWLGLYEACYVIAREMHEGSTVSEDEPTYGAESAKRPQPSHLVAALKNGAEALNQCGAFWVLGGGIAINYHGRERATRDVDFFILEDKDRLSPIIESLAARELRQHTIERPSFMPPDALFWWVPLQFGLPDAAPVDVDLLVAPHEFMAFIHATGIESSIAGKRVRVAGAEALIVLKLKAYRDQDKADLQHLLASNKKLDRPLLDAWVEKFKLGERLQEMERAIKNNPGRRG